jgi:hypothetical protein
VKPTSTLDLIANNVLLKLTNNTVVTCNSRGEQVRLLDDVCNGSIRSCFHLNVTRDKNFAILYSWKTIENPTKGIHNRQGKHNSCRCLFLSTFMKLLSWTYYYPLF